MVAEPAFWPQLCGCVMLVNKQFRNISKASLNYADYFVEMKFPSRNVKGLHSNIGARVKKIIYRNFKAQVGRLK